MCIIYNPETCLKSINIFISNVTKRSQEQQCAGCINACYIGETSRHLSTRMNEHLTSDKSSHIYKHLSESPNCRLLNSPSSFKILDQASTEYDLRIKEAVYIQLHRPSLNKQVKHVNLKLSL